MDSKNMQIEFERRVQLIDPSLIITNKPSSDLIFSILNEAQDRYVMMNYVGDDQMEAETNIHTRNTDSIKSLLVEKDLTSVGLTSNGFTRYRLPYSTTDEYFLYVHSFSKVKALYPKCCSLCIMKPGAKGRHSSTTFPHIINMAVLAVSLKCNSLSGFKTPCSSNQWEISKKRQNVN